MRREPDGEDVRHDDDVVRSLDDARELSDACGPWFDMSVFMELASIMDAFLDGQRGTAAGANPWDVNSEHYSAWERGRSAAELARLNRSRRFA